MIRGTWGDEDGKRFKDVYFSMFKGVFTTGDGAAIDADGDFWLKGRIDDVLNVSGHRIGTSDVEGALVSAPAGRRGRRGRLPAPDQGHGHLRLRDAQRRRGAERRPQEGARRARAQGRRPHRDAGQDAVRATGLPKTRSGKIMRRILRKIAEGEFDSLGDTSTLADPAVVEDLKANKQ